MKIVTRGQIGRKSAGKDLKEEKPGKLWRVGVASEPTAAFFRRLNQYWPQENAALQSWFKTEGEKENAQSEFRRTFLETQLNKGSWTGPNFILSKVFKLKLC